MKKSKNIKQKIQNLKRARISKHVKFNFVIPCRIVDTDEYSLLAATDYTITNLIVEDKHSQFELWDDQGYIFTYEVNTAHIAVFL